MNLREQAEVGMQSVEASCMRAMCEGCNSFGLTETYYNMRLFDGVGIPREYARAALRSLTDKGYCRFRNGLFNDEGMTAGSGYAPTGTGIKWLRSFEGIDQ